MKKIIIVVLGLLFITNTVAGLVTFYPNVVFVNGNFTVGFSDTNGITTEYFEMGSDYVVFNEYNLSFVASGAIEVNVSEYTNVSSLDSGNNTLLRFNVTRSSGNVAFTFTNSNTSDLNYTLYVDSVEISTHTSASFGFSYNSWSTHDFEITGTIRPDCPYNGSSTYHSGTNTVNITWSTGNNSDSNVVVMKTTGFPSSPTDGTEVQNNTEEYYNFSAGTTQYYSIWGFNSSFNSFSPNSCKLDVNWGVINISVYNQSSPWQVVSPFGILISNVDGSQVYQNVTTSPHLINVLDIPYGDDVIFLVNGTGYKDTKITHDISLNTYIQMDIYLAPIETSVDPGGGDPGGSGENFSTTEHYIIQVIDELNNPVPDAKVTIYFYNNYTDSWDERESFTTDGYGQGDVWLVPGVLYKIDIEAAGYTTLTGQNWIPSYIEYSDDRYKTFQIEFEDITPQYPDNPFECITYSYGIGGTTLYANFSSNCPHLEDVDLYVYEMNLTTNTTTLFGSYSDTTDFTTSFANIDNNCNYLLVYFYNHSYWSNQTFTGLVIGSSVRTPPTSPSEIRDLFNPIFGFNPFGWHNFLMWLFMIAGFYYADQRDAGKILVIMGGMMLFLNFWVGFQTALVLLAGGVIPVLFIVMGLMVIWNDTRKRESD